MNYWSSLAAALLLAGCTAPVVKIPIGQAALLYGDWRYLQGALTVTVSNVCKAKKFSEAECAWMRGEMEKAAIVDKDFRKSLSDAKGEVDMEKVMQYAEILAGIVVKAGAL